MLITLLKIDYNVNQEVAREDPKLQDQSVSVAMFVPHTSLPTLCYVQSTHSPDTYAQTTNNTTLWKCIDTSAR